MKKRVVGAIGGEAIPRFGKGVNHKHLLKENHMNATTKKHAMIQSALLVALSFAGTQMAAAAPKVPELPSGWEACGGVAKAGMNDCAVKTSLHSCVGMSKTDNEADSYVFLPKGLCTKIANGTVLAITKDDLAKMKEGMMKKM